MSAPAYDTAKLAKNLADGYGYEKEKADGLVSTTHQMIAEATKTFADKDFVEFQFRTQREYFDVQLGVLSRDIGRKIEVMSKDIAIHTKQIAELQSNVTQLQSDVAGLKSDVVEMRSDIAEMRSDIAEMRSDMKVIFLRFVYAAITAIALMQGLDWLFENLG